MDTIDRLYEAIAVRDKDDVGSNRSNNRPLVELIDARLGRRAMLRGLMAGTATGAVAALATTTAGKAALAQSSDASTLTFTQPAHRIMDDHQVAEGYDADILIRWGDQVTADAPAWQATALTAEGQARQFGYNSDFLAYLPLPRGSDSSDHGLLFASHEYTNPELMFRGWSLDEQTPEQTAIEMAAHGGSVVEVRKEDGKWRVVDGSRYGRRITADMEMRISGPAAGHELMKTGYDQAGTRVLGTLNNCAGGTTPWGTVLTAEENWHGYFGGGDAENAPQAHNYRRYGLESEARYPWHRTVERFDIAKEPNEPNRFGWIVEVDPYDPQSMPVKRTALGRFKHEGATSFVNRDSRVVLYSGDDERFEYLYRFVTAGRFNPDDPAANRDLLDDGTLSVARFDEDSVTWLPLVFGQGPLTPENGFESQADVLIETRRAADLLGATPMDRPEDVEPNPVNGRVYMMLTNNSRRKAGQVDAANPRPANAHGQVVELVPPGGTGGDADHAAETFGWNMFLLAGNPAEEGSGAVYHPATDVWISSPDNCAIDPKGRLWISTDQGSAQAKNGIPDGMYACDVDGAGRALVKFFYGTPRDAEMCGPVFTPDGTTLFVAPQHPGESDGSTFDNPTTRWPDFAEGVPPRPSVVAITKRDGGEIGS